MSSKLHQPVSGEKPPHHADRVLRLIAVFKYVKAILLIAIGLGTLQLIRSDLREQARLMFETLGSSIDALPVIRLLREIGALPAGRLRLVGVGAFLYAALFLVEGTGLWLQRRWAEYLTVVATASFIPFEIFEIVRRLTYPRVGALVINIIVVIYLVYRIRHPPAWALDADHNAEHEKEEDAS